MTTGEPNDETEQTEKPRPAQEEGFSTAERVLGAAAAYKAPLASSVVASAMLRNEQDPTRRRQLAALRNGALIWMGLGVVGALIAVIVVVHLASSTGAGGSCRGGIDRLDPMDTTYQTSGGNHWTATYPCRNGGSKTVSVPRNKVPGGG